uniref:Uncharacterized protein n=1 Tax=Plectus sambesii TaxID=2011161 RepID=A0A914W251_9BILA
MLVKIGMNIISVLDVNEQQEYIKLTVSFDHRWHDDFLTWDPAKFNGTTSIIVPADIIWMPDVTVTSTVLDTEYIIEKKDLNPEIKYTGDVRLNFGYVLSNRCEMKTDNFPFDSQECVFVMSSWSFTTNKITLEHIGGQRPIQNLNSEWDVFPYTNETTDYYLEPENPRRRIIYRMKIKRKSSYYVWVIIAPTFIISALSIAGMFAPFSNTGDREEKVSLGLTTLLTLAVILSLVTGEMPRSTNLPLLGRFVLFEISICVLSVALSICTMFLHQRATTRQWAVPRWLLYIVLCRRSDRINDGPEIKLPKSEVDSDQKRSESLKKDAENVAVKRLYPILFQLLVSFIENGETSERDVISHIFESYDKRSRPVRNDSQVTLVKVRMNVLCLLEVNEQQEYIKLTVSFDNGWHDNFLIWDPAKFNGTRSIIVSADMVWRPDVTVASTVLEPEYITEKEDWNLEIKYTGDVWLNFVYVLSNRCEMKTDNFPFDSQECLFVMSSWTYTIDKITLEHIDDQKPIGSVKDSFINIFQ